MFLELLASAVVSLVVALFNLLVAGYALATGVKEPRKLVFAAGPAGVGIWALAWFISIFDAPAHQMMRGLGLLGALIAVSGFLTDALWGRTQRQLVGLLAGMGTVAVICIAVVGQMSPSISTGAPLMGRMVALTMLGGLGVARWMDLSSDSTDLRRFARRTLVVLGGTAALFGAVATAVWGLRRPAVDGLLFAILAAELIALVYVVERRIQVEVLLSRAIVYVSMVGLVAAAASGTFFLIGYEVDIVVVATTSAISLGAAATFMALSEPLAGWVERRLFPEHGRIQKALVASRSEAMALRRRLERVEKLAFAGELAASVAHEIKNPLAPVRGYAQMLSGKLDDVSPEQRAIFKKGLDIIQGEVDRIDRRVHELLDLARGGRDLASSEEVMDVVEVILDVVAVAEAEPGIGVIEKDLAAPSGWVHGNADEIRGALLNLLRNAAEAMLETDGECVTVRTWVRDADIVVEILDEGPGITEADAERIFQPFYTTKASGTGLGMAIARSAVEAAGGHLTIGPRTDRRGTIARIELIRADAG